MTHSRAAIYGLGGTLLVAYLAAANMPGPGSAPTERAREQPAAATEAIADDVRAQAGRLQQRMKQAPVPQTTSRNPFAFGMTPRPRAAESFRAAPVVEPESLPAIPPPPTLTLMGIAEETLPQGVRRTAIIAGDGDTLFMVGEGQPVGDRYKVTKIGAGAVELEDLVSRAYRRLAL